MAKHIQIRRAYDDPDPNDGFRVLVDRHWPRGRSREALKLDIWARDIAPEPTLIAWFGHRLERWAEFREKYLEHLAQPQLESLLRDLIAQSGDRDITLVYGAKDTEHNQAVVLAEVLGQMFHERHDSKD